MSHAGNAYEPTTANDTASALLFRVKTHHMPIAPKRPCKRQGCPALVVSGYCDKHAKAAVSAGAAYDATKRKHDPALALAARIRSGTRWQKVRTLHASIDPLCCDPFGDHKGMPVPRAQCHHIKPLATHPHLAHDLSNLASLCTHCHRKLEALERKGEDTARLFIEKM